MFYLEYRKIEDYHDCADNPCALNATCIDLVNDFECQNCPKGFRGKRCHIKEDLCVSSPCVHGTCVDSLFKRSCLCEEGWTGENCETNIDECVDSPCKNGATCIDGIGNFTCHCQAGYRGVRCQHLIDHCAAQPCSNNATCTNLGPSYHCACLLGFDGVHCEHNIDECKLGKCNALGTETCQDGVNSFECVCKQGWTGENCEHKIDQCADSPCQNNATCVDIGSTFRCDCKPPWSGIRCEIEMGFCSSNPNPCKNDGHCVNLLGDYFCVCPEGVSGKNCEIAPNRCLGEPCLHGGVCGDFGSRLECACPKGYTGAGCQYLEDSCAPGVCKNGGECQRTSSGFHCKCTPGFTGSRCETNVDDCSSSPCPESATCIDQINTHKCLCSLNMTGAECDKPIEVDYDLHFYDPVRPSMATQSVPARLNGTAYTISLWVKFDAPNAKGTVLRMMSSSNSNYMTNDAWAMVIVTSEEVILRYKREAKPLHLHFPANQRINDGYWNHLVISWSAKSGTYSLVWNSIRLFADNWIDRRYDLNHNVTLVLGSAEYPVFEGLITRVNLWNRLLDFEKEIPIMVAGCQAADEIFDGLLVRFENYNEIVGKVERIPKSSCGREKRRNFEDENGVIRVEDCPTDQLLVSHKREMNVSWPEPTFIGVHPIVRVEKNMKQGQIVTWGEYDVLYVAHDNATNTAQCNFKIRVTREHCTDLPHPINGIQACENWGPQLKYKACSIECRDGFEFPRTPAIFYTCGADGEWRPREERNVLFRYPQCTKSVPATRVVHMSVNYPATNLCNSASKDALKNKLYEALNSVNRKWNLCTLTDNNGCVGLQVDVKCENEEEDETELVRSIRATSPSALRVQIEIPVKRNSVNEPGSIIKLSPADVIQNEVINGTTFNFEKVLPNGRPDLSSFQLVEEFSCQPGQVPIGDSCVPCAPGQFHSSVTNQCELCAEGDYQPLTGRTECFKCPTGQITPGKGAIYEQECKPNCPPGHQLDAATSTCVPCGFGFYQPSGGSFTCIACGVGKTTLTDKATSEQECRDECPDGEQLSHAGICQACPVGSYRTRGEHKQCIECPIGTTTEGKSSTRREQCNTPRCNPGQFLVRET
ncbi:hypothetical protein WR25_22379 isoform C [Diploscapter pachys]|nr:hypothetical protein WR25_22379 isoform C [Diploscapter pachys]